MTISLDWVILEIECFPLNNGQRDVVAIIRWKLEARDGQTYVNSSGNTVPTYACVIGHTDLKYEKGAPFTPYDQLTKDQVVEWIVDGLGEDTYTQIIAGLAKEVIEQTTPSIVKMPLPFSQE